MGVGDCVFDSIFTTLETVKIYYESREEFIECDRIFHIVVSLLKLTREVDWFGSLESIQYNESKNEDREALAKEIIEEFEF